MKSPTALATVAATLIALLTINTQAADLVPVKSQFNADEIKWIQSNGNSSISGAAFLQLNEKEQKGCSGFGVELLPVADYSNERILKIYGNNSLGKVLMKNNPPKFTPDPKEYHELVRKSQCDEKNQFSFKDLPAGEYYVIFFIIWKNEVGVDDGGALMKRVSLKAGENAIVQINK
ncbi:hypothetical protein D0C16_24045 [Cellvibrio sp. KY-GH-1]|uniref:hypothetical protein n=1 Tax=Cellvibrio sp. KY-GH-1 TaxID=2303332 RepID=UPI0012479DA3|nr:hypothetical protein [Cellvibrio sp. KY-GH-1]QEY18784.1 hypothetical protein D0C16_24045 [Cellvibrio sp. KY-GH-1]